MRFAGPVLFAVCLGGCLIDSPSNSDPYYPPDNSGWGSGYGGSGGADGFGCHQDSECGNTGLVCARDGECLSASAVRIIHINWTVNEMPASTTTCVHAPQLAVSFLSAGQEGFGFAPVPCNAGRYTIDKFPLRFNQIQLTRQNEYSGGETSFFDQGGNATIDLHY